MDTKSREELTALIEEKGGVNWWDPQEFVARVQARLPTGLSVLSVPPSSSANFNCFVYTFGLENDPEFLGGKNPIQKEFVQHLLAIGVLKKTENPLSSDFIFYKNGQGDITHGGILVNEHTVRSKWMWGALFLHTIWDVPSSFGNEVFYCARVDAMEIKRAYIEYRNSGVEIKPIS